MQSTSLIFWNLLYSLVDYKQSFVWILPIMLVQMGMALHPGRSYPYLIKITTKYLKELYYRQLWDQIWTLCSNRSMVKVKVSYSWSGILTLVWNLCVGVSFFLFSFCSDFFTHSRLVLFIDMFNYCSASWNDLCSNVAIMGKEGFDAAVMCRGFKRFAFFWRKKLTIIAKQWKEAIFHYFEAQNTWNLCRVNLIRYNSGSTMLTPRKIKTKTNKISAYQHAR